MSRHNAQLRAAASAYENAEPDYGDDELWAQAIQLVAADMRKGDSLNDLIDTLTWASPELREAAGAHHWHPLRGMLNWADTVAEDVRTKYDELIANGGRP